MYVEAIRKKGKGLYIVTIDGNEYTFFESVILEFRLVLGHETNQDEINKAIMANELEEFYSKALGYTVRYGKCEAEVKKYLLSKNVSYSGTNAIIERLKKNRILVDDKLIDSLIYSYMKSGNGKIMISHKLKEKGFKNDVIDNHLDNIDYDEYIDSLKNLYNKIKNKYSKDDERVRTLKIKRYLIQRGYSLSDIEHLGL